MALLIYSDCTDSHYSTPFKTPSNHSRSSRDLFASKFAGDAHIVGKLRSISYLHSPEDSKDGAPSAKCLLHLDLRLCSRKAKDLQDFALKLTFNLPEYGYKEPTVRGCKLIDLQNETKYADGMSWSCGSFAALLDERRDAPGFSFRSLNRMTFGATRTNVASCWNLRSQVILTCGGHLRLKPGHIESIPLCILLDYPPPFPPTSKASPITVDVALMYKQRSNIGLSRNYTINIRKVLVSDGPSVPLSLRHPAYARPEIEQAIGRLELSEAFVEGESTNKQADADAVAMSEATTANTLANSARLAVQADDGAHRNHPDDVTATAEPAAVSATQPANSSGIQIGLESYQKTTGHKMSALPADQSASTAEGPSRQVRVMSHHSTSREAAKASSMPEDTNLRNQPASSTDVAIDPAANPPLRASGVAPTLSPAAMSERDERRAQTIFTLEGRSLNQRLTVPAAVSAKAVLTTKRASQNANTAADLASAAHLEQLPEEETPYRAAIPPPLPSVAALRRRQEKREELTMSESETSDKSVLDDDIAQRPGAEASRAPNARSRLADAAVDQRQARRVPATSDLRDQFLQQQATAGSRTSATAQTPLPDMIDLRASDDSPGCSSLIDFVIFELCANKKERLSRALVSEGWRDTANRVYPHLYNVYGDAVIALYWGTDHQAVMRAIMTRIAVIYASSFTKEERDSHNVIA